MPLMNITDALTGTFIPFGSKYDLEIFNATPQTISVELKDGANKTIKQDIISDGFRTFKDVVSLTIISGNSERFAWLAYKEETNQFYQHITKSD